MFLRLGLVTSLNDFIEFHSSCYRKQYFFEFCYIYLLILLLHYLDHWKK